MTFWLQGNGWIFFKKEEDITRSSLFVSSDGLGTRNPGFGFWNFCTEWLWRNGFKASWTRLFFIFCHIWWGVLFDLQRKGGVKQRTDAIFSVFQSGTCWRCASQNSEKSSNLPIILQKMKKRLVQIALNQILSDSGYPKIRFQVPDPSLMYVATPTSVKVSQKKTFFSSYEKERRFVWLHTGSTLE